MPKAVNINCRDACQITGLADDVVMISVNEEYEELYPLELKRDHPRVLTLKFSDVLCPRESNGNEIHPISPEDVIRLVDFIDEHKDKHFVVHCAAGISRSSAICLYLHMVYGHELKPDFWRVSHPNKYVVGAMMIKRVQKLSKSS